MDSPNALPRHQTSMTVLMTPDMANFSGNVHGGTILKLLDQVAYACAARYAARYVVTLSVDQVVFREPIHVGELVTFLACVNHTGTSSMEVGVKVLAEDIRTQRVRHVDRGTDGLGREGRREVADLAGDPVPHQLDPAVTRPSLLGHRVDQQVGLDLVGVAADVALGARHVSPATDQPRQVLALLHPAGVGG